MKSVAIYCGSRPGRNDAYRQAAETLVDKLIEKNVSIIYGGGNVGLMGIVANRAIARGGKITGVMPHALIEREHAHRGLSEFIQVKDMHERKQTMSELAQAFITLPGGAGSMDELFQEIALRQVSYHNKPAAILNTAGYYDHLLAWFKHAVAEGLINQNAFNQLVIDSSPITLVNRLLEARQ